MRVKIFGEYPSEHVLEDAVNKYIAELNNNERIADMKFSVVGIPNEANYFSVMLVIEKFTNSK